MIVFVLEISHLKLFMDSNIELNVMVEGIWWISLHAYKLAWPSP